MSRDSTIGTVYLLHFDAPVQHAQHYLGWAVDVHDRVNDHLAGKGARLVAVALERGVGVSLVRTWPDADRHLERALKRRNNARGLCPVCVEGHNARAAASMRATRRRRAQQAGRA